MQLAAVQRPWLPPPVPVNDPIVVAVAARKGGIGKSTLAYELAAAWGGVLVDLDWDDGGATIMWGARPSESVMVALEGGPPPRIRSAPGRPDLVPCYPDLSAAGWKSEEVANALERWATAWGRPIVVDSHPGIGELAFGAMMAAHVTVVPVILAERELDALGGMLRAHPSDRIIVAPNRVPPVPGERQLRRLAQLTSGRCPVAPAVSYYPWLSRRALRSALVLSRPYKATAPAVRELTLMATTVRSTLPEAA